MRNRIATLFVLAAALSLEAAVASAQDTSRARSQRRIKVGKEAPPPPVQQTVRVDTVQVPVYRTDTLRLPGATVTRIDTVRTTVTRYDTVQVPAPLRRIGGFYWGLAAGASMPAANFNDPNKPGWRAELPFGWDPIGSPIGLRFNVGYAMNSTHSWVSKYDNASIINFDGSLKWRIGQRDFFDQGYSMYALTGATYNMAKNTLRIDEKGNRYKMGDVITARPILPPADDEFVNQFGWLLGLGAQAAWGRTNVFAEVRYSRVGKDPYNLAHVPVVFGVAFY